MTLAYEGPKNPSFAIPQSETEIVQPKISLAAISEKAKLRSIEDIKKPASKINLVIDYTIQPSFEDKERTPDEYLLAETDYTNNRHKDTLIQILAALKVAIDNAKKTISVEIQDIQHTNYFIDIDSNSISADYRGHDAFDANSYQGKLVIQVNEEVYDAIANTLEALK